MKELITFTDDPLALAALADWLEEQGDGRAGAVRRVARGDVWPHESVDRVRYFFTFLHHFEPSAPWNLTRDMADRMAGAGLVTVDRDVHHLDLFYFPSRADAVRAYVYCLLS